MKRENAATETMQRTRCVLVHERQNSRNYHDSEWGKKENERKGNCSSPCAWKDTAKRLVLADDTQAKEKYRTAFLMVSTRKRW